ncbi:MAG: glycosyltransferase [Candidatus Competibacter sp.]|nr:glycosyltransferase [Candidatus Competibacter sp.]
MRILFVGESWLGSCARSLKEALARNPQVILDEVNEDLFVPKHRARWLRAINRLLKPAHRQELYRQIQYRVEVFKPDVVMTYKGHPISAGFIRQLQALGCTVVNVYPDYSPHAYGVEHQQAVGAYDLVISTKPFHPASWRNVYGYENRCVFVPQGYDPALHYVGEPVSNECFDVVLVANWRHEYGILLADLGKLLPDESITVCLGGPGWAERREQFPKHWEFAGALLGRSYIECLRSGRIVIAPVTRQVIINGHIQPGDEDTTRTYELAAAHCFFIHRRTDFVKTLYDENMEVPMFDTVDELSEKICYYLPKEEIRYAMANATQCRAVPDYSLDNRAQDIYNEIYSFFGI